MIIPFIKEIRRAKIITNGIGKTNFPIIPVIKNIGVNARAEVIIVAVTGLRIEWVPSTAASSGDFPSSH